jgi:hypothetical protein
MNRNLEKKSYKIDDEIIKSLNNQFSKFSNSNNVWGYNIIKNIISGKTKILSGYNLKQIKSRIENIPRVKMLYGDDFYNWINNTLKTVRDSENSTKELKKKTGHNVRSENYTSKIKILINENILWLKHQN